MAEKWMLYSRVSQKNFGILIAFGVLYNPVHHHDHGFYHLNRYFNGGGHSLKKHVLCLNARGKNVFIYVNKVMSILFENTANDTKPLNQYITESLVGNFWNGQYKLTQNSIKFTFTHKQESNKVITVEIKSDEPNKPRESVYAVINAEGIEYIMNYTPEGGDRCETDEIWMTKPVSEYELRLLAAFSSQPPQGDKPTHQSCIRRKPQGGAAAKNGAKYVKTDCKCKCKDGVSRTIYVKKSQKGGTNNYIKKRNTNGSYEFIRVN